MFVCMPYILYAQCNIHIICMVNFIEHTKVKKKEIKSNKKKVRQFKNKVIEIKVCIVAIKQWKVNNKTS